MITFKANDAQDSHFTRRQEGDRTIFTVQPASWPLGAGGCFIMLAIPLGLMGLMFMPAGFILLLIGGGIAFLGWKALQNDKKINDTRTPFDIVVTPDALLAGGKTIQKSDIVEFIYDSPSGSGQSVTEVHVTTGSSWNTGRTGAQIGRDARAQIEAARAKVSYWVGVRARSDSRPIKIAENLSADTARALASDLAGMN